MRNIRFHKIAIEDYNYWKNNDKTIHSKIRLLLDDISERPFTGLGKPEPLKHELHGYWSRRITNEHRLVYKVLESEIFVISCRYHYNK